MRISIIKSFLASTVCSVDELLQSISKQTKLIIYALPIMGKKVNGQMK